MTRLATVLPASFCRLQQLLIHLPALRTQENSHQLQATHGSATCRDTDDNDEQSHGWQPGAKPPEPAWPEYIKLRQAARRPILSVGVALARCLQVLMELLSDGRARPGQANALSSSSKRQTQHPTSAAASAFPTL
jgi:hypothetical protein